MTTIVDAARYLVFLSYKGTQYSLTPLKLQKLLFLAQGWSYVWDNKPLFQEQFEAWQYGPVNPTIYETFRQYGRNEIPNHEGADSITDLVAKDTLSAIWDEYGRYSAFYLVELTHHQDPWLNAKHNGSIIDNSEIKKYFQSTYK